DDGHNENRDDTLNAATDQIPPQRRQPDSPPTPVLLTVASIFVRSPDRTEGSKKWKEERDRGECPGRSGLEVLLRRQLLLGLTSAAGLLHHSGGLGRFLATGHHAADDDPDDQADHEQTARERVERQGDWLRRHVDCRRRGAYGDRVSALGREDVVERHRRAAERREAHSL